MAEKPAKKKKTWAREFSALMLGFLGFIAVEGNTEVLEILVWPTMTFAIPAFSLKQDSVKDAMSRRSEEE